MNAKFSTGQAVWFAIINYVGVAIGMVSTLFIYPNDKDLLGVIRFIDGFAQILYPVMVLGASTALLNFQPRLSELLQRKLFSYSIISILWMILFCAAATGLIYMFGSMKNTEYFIYGFGIAVCLAFADLFRRQATNLQKLAVPTFYEKIIPKLSLPLVFVIILYASVSLTKGLVIYTVSFVLMMVLTGTYLFRFFKPVYTLRYEDLFSEIPRKHYYQYSLYAFCASLGSFFAFRIDSVMIPEFISNTANGDFNIGVNLANALMIPATGVFTLYSPVISEALKKNELGLLRVKYAEVAKNLFFIGILMYGCVVLGMQDFFMLLPTADKLLPALPVLYILGANVILNMATGFNTEIIAYSKYYRFNLIAILLLAVLNVGLNYYVLTRTDFGIEGVAWASFGSMCMFNLAKLLFIYRKFHLLPVNSAYLKTIGLSLFLLLCCYLLPLQVLGPMAFVARCGVFAVVFTGAVYRTGWVPEWNNAVNRILRK